VRNPYQSLLPLSDPLSQGKASWVSPFCVLALVYFYAYPLFVVGAIYIFWILTAIDIGVLPRRPFDWSENVILKIFGNFCVWQLVLAPFVFLISISCAICFPFWEILIQRKLHGVILSIVLCVFLWVVACVIIDWDPGGVFCWFFD
jgi:hypothetical protein